MEHEAFYRATEKIVKQNCNHASHRGSEEEKNVNN